jgi:hypothetical protein
MYNHMRSKGKWIDQGNACAMDIACFLLTRARMSHTSSMISSEQVVNSLFGYEDFP